MAVDAASDSAAVKRHHCLKSCWTNIALYNHFYNVTLWGVIWLNLLNFRKFTLFYQLAKQMETGSVLICLSGRGDKDMDYIIENYGIR